MDEIVEFVRAGNHDKRCIYPAARRTHFVDNSSSRVNFSSINYQSGKKISQPSFHDPAIQGLHQGGPLKAKKMAATSSTTKGLHWGKIKFTEDEIEKVQRDTKRYLLMGYSKFGITPETAYGGDSSEDSDEEHAEASTAHSNDQGSAATQQQVRKPPPYGGKDAAYRCGRNRTPAASLSGA
jgi:hypothetical protein